MNRLEQLRLQWVAELEKIDDGYADALEDGTDPVRMAQLEGMIAAYQQIIRDAAR